MRTKRAFVLLSVLLSAILVTGCQVLPFGQTAVAQPPTTADVSRGTLEIAVTSSGNITLPQITKLGFSGAVSGSQAGNAILAELNVRMGSSVTKGQVVARLDTAAQERDLLRLQNSLDAAALALQKAKEPAYKPEDIAKAEASMTVARANLEYAREALKKAQNPYTENDFAKTEAAVRNATADLRNARAAVTTAELKLQDDTVKDNRAVQDAIETLVKTQKLLEQNKTTEYEVQKALESLEVARNQQSNNLITLQNNIAKARDAVAAAEAALASAEFTLSDMLAKKNGDPLDVKQKQNTVVSAEAAVINAEQTLSLMRQPPDPLDIKLKEIQLASAQLQVDDAKLQLEKSTIIAPFDGVIGDFKAKVGDAIAPASFVIPIVDTTQARVDAFIEEYDVNSVKVGMPATVTVDSVRGRTFNGTVDAISPLATTQQGIVRYAVTIRLEGVVQTAAAARTGAAAGAAGQRPAGGAPPGAAPAPGAGGQRPAGATGQTQASRPAQTAATATSLAAAELKDGMSATARIVVNKKDNVVLVPNRALVFQGGVQKVQVQVNGQAQDRAVRVGLSNDQYTEITEGVDEGDKVVIQTVSAPSQNTFRPPSGPGGGMIPGIR